MNYQKRIYKKFGTAGIIIYPLFIAATLILFFSIIYQYQLFGVPSIKTTNYNSTIGWTEYLYFSATAFFSSSFGDYLPLGIYRLITLLENVLGLFFFANIVGLIFSDLRDEAKEEIWIPLKDKAYEELEFELDRLKTNINSVLGIYKISDENGSYLSKQYKDITPQNISLKLKETLLSGNYGNLFKNGNEIFKDIHVKYQEYFEPEITAIINEIERTLRYIDEDISLNKDRNKKQIPQSEEELFEEILDNLIKIVNYIDSIYGILSKKQS